MKTDRLLDAIGNMNDSYILEAAAPRRRPRALRRVAVIAAAAVLCVLLGIPALAAADVTPAYELLYSVSPAAAQSLKPVRMSCEDNGIRMGVEAASVEGSEAHVLLILKDLEGDRVDETTDLFDSYTINPPFDSTATCEIVNYDAAEKTATYLITVKRMDEKEIRSGKVTFSTTCFLSGKQNRIVELSEIELYSGEAPLMTDPELRGGSGDAEQADAQVMLEPMPEMTYTPTAGVRLTAAGFVGGKLRIQAYYDDIGSTDNHGFIYLLDAQGREVLPRSSVAAWDAAHSGSYEDYVFDIGPEEITDYRIYGDFTTCDSLTTGNWQVTFSLR